MNLIFCFSFVCERQLWRNHFGKSYSHTVVYPSLLFLCLICTLHLNHYKGHWNILHTCNMFYLAGEWKSSQNKLHPGGSGASSCTNDTYVCISVVHGWIQNPTAAAKLLLPCMMLSRCPSTVATLWPVTTHSELSLGRSFAFQHFLNVDPCPHIYFRWTFLVSNIFGKGKLTVSSPSNVMVISENVPVHWMSALTRTRPRLGDPWRLLVKKKKKKTTVREVIRLSLSFCFSFFKFNYRVLKVVLQYCSNDPWWLLWNCFSCQH